MPSRAKHFDSAAAKFSRSTKYGNCCHVSNQVGSGREFAADAAIADDAPLNRLLVMMNVYPDSDKSFDKAWQQQQSKPLGRSRVEEDTDQDGVYDRATRAVGHSCVAASVAANRYKSLQPSSLSSG